MWEPTYSELGKTIVVAALKAIMWPECQMAVAALKANMRPERQMAIAAFKANMRLVSHFFRSCLKSWPSEL